MKRFVFFGLFFAICILAIYYLPKGNISLNETINGKSNKEHIENLESRDAEGGIIPSTEKDPGTEKIVLSDTEKNPGTEQLALSDKEEIPRTEQLAPQEKEKMEEFKHRFQQLNQAADSKLHALLEQAKNEYTSKQEKKLDLSHFGAKYEAIYINYEKHINEEFALLTKSFEHEIKEDPKEVNFFSEFNAQKHSRKDLFQAEIKSLEEFRGNKD
ncbi:hypothetical protein [Lederbergia panacisoli]|uniref:hypothetical protein n=1 Tax=Lederbergia panacisoli TaxID=1255251 RepID=UPI00214BA9BB|nr:hypothetical protein [Lederbergia panacisoli]MCR2821439.1 hypothetical protein [Lederbergia panacisoli]